MSATSPLSSVPIEMCPFSGKRIWYCNPYPMIMKGTPRFMNIEPRANSNKLGAMDYFGVKGRGWQIEEERQVGSRADLHGSVLPDCAGSSSNQIMFAARALLHWLGIPIDYFSASPHHWNGTPLLGCNLLPCETQQAPDIEQPALDRTII
jgi:hypothetical protein